MQSAELDGKDMKFVLGSVTHGQYQGRHFDQIIIWVVK